MFEGHPNLLPAYFEDDPRASAISNSYIRKPIFSREGSNVSLMEAGRPTIEVEGPYGAEGFILQQFHRLPEFDGNFTVVGSWLIASRPSGIGIREDDTLVTRDSSRFLPHIILD
jgi:glutathionylspermidine synthase